MSGTRNDVPNSVLVCVQHKNMKAYPGKAGIPFLGRTQSLLSSLVVASICFFLCLTSFGAPGTSRNINALQRQWEESGTEFAIVGPYLIISKDLVREASGQNPIPQEFLLREAVVPQEHQATGNSVLSRVVYFQHEGTRLLLKESPQGLIRNPGIEGHIVLASLPLVEGPDLTKARRLYPALNSYSARSAWIIDINSGLDRVFLSEPFTFSHDTGHTDPEERFVAQEADARHILPAYSRVEKAPRTSPIAGPILSFRQIAQLRLAHSLPTVEVRYALSPYVPNPKFQIRYNRQPTLYRYFESPSQLDERGQARAPIQRWNTDKPIVFHISANTPARYRKAIEAGILYWNRVFGKSLFQVKEAPQDATAPHPLYSMVQWLDHDNMGFAYADWDTDPRTGEILSGSIFIPHSFAEGVRRHVVYSRFNQAETALSPSSLPSSSSRSLSLPLSDSAPRPLIRPEDQVVEWLTTSITTQPSSDEEEQQKGGRLSSPRFVLDKSPLRGGSSTPEINDALASMMDAHLQEMQTRAVDASLAATVAHEIGHTLGLAHNFMAHSGNVMSSPLRDATYGLYLLTGQMPPADAPVTHSIMDYLTFKDDTIAGAQILDGQPPFLYDRLAIKAGYEGVDFRDQVAELPPAAASTLGFASDYDAGNYDDVNLNEASTGYPVIDAYNRLEAASQSVARNFLIAFRDAKAPQSELDRRSVAEVTFDPMNSAFALADEYWRMLIWLDSSSRSAFFDRTVVRDKNLSLKQHQEEMAKWIAAQFNHIGMSQAILGPLVSDGAPTNPKELTATLKSLLKKNRRLGFPTHTPGKRLFFSAEEEAQILEKSKTYFSEVSRLFRLICYRLLAKARYDRVPDSARIGGKQPFSQEWIENIKNIAEHLLLVQRKNVGGQVQGQFRNGPRLVVQNFIYSQWMRFTALEMLAPTHGTSPAWGSEAREELISAFVEEFENGTGADITKAKSSDFSGPLREWVTEELTIFQFMVILWPETMEMIRAGTLSSKGSSGTSEVSLGDLLGAMTAQKSLSSSRDLCQRSLTPKTPTTSRGKITMPPSRRRR